MNQQRGSSQDKRQQILIQTVKFEKKNQRTNSKQKSSQLSQSKPKDEESKDSDEKKRLEAGVNPLQ